MNKSFMLRNNSILHDLGLQKITHETFTENKFPQKPQPFVYVRASVCLSVSVYVCLSVCVYVCNKKVIYSIYSTKYM